MTDSLRGKAALVTGAGSGLGEATALALGRAGCAVACLDQNREGAARTAAALTEMDTEALGFECDVSDAGSIFAAVERALAAWGRIDIAVNCAAVDYVTSVDEMSIDQWDRVIAVNLRGPFLVAKAVLPAMKRQQSGHIVHIAS
ncbi:MAG TPA: SDR family NAD(P)-dependent oxidoreductase, partial [Thermomicrobiales bacterium]|nr:SDR family NAD(P)-dependent oxidoreductase [Thermomicrobiales bacterium]